MMHQEPRSALAGEEAGGPEAAILLQDGQADRDTWRSLLVPALLLLLLLAPLGRQGIPATRAGALWLDRSFVAPLLPPFFAASARIVPFGEPGYKLALACAVMGAALSLLLLAMRVWGQRLGWWVASLWLMLPTTVSLLYQGGWPAPFVALSFVALALALAPRRGPWWLALLLVGPGLALLWGVQAPLQPFQLFASLWPSSVSVHEWLSAPSYQLGIVPLTLTALAAMMAWSRRAESAARKVLWFAGIAALCAALTLLPGPVFLWLMMANGAMVLAVGGVPVLDGRYATPPGLMALLAVAALAAYPYLQPAWLDDAASLPAPRQSPTSAGVSSFRPGVLAGQKELLLLELSQQRDGATVLVEALWQVVAPPRRDYTAFVQFVDETGAQVAQADALLVDEGQLPSSGWPLGYLVRQRYRVTSERRPSQLFYGLYDRETLQRLPLAAPPSLSPSPSVAPSYRVEAEQSRLVVEVP